MTAKLKKPRHSGESRNPVPLGVREGPITPYLTKPKNSSQSAAQTTLGEICEKPEYGWTTKANHGSGTIHLLRTSDITSGTVDWDSVPYCTEVPSDLERYLVRDGDILISRAGSVGVSNLVTSPAKGVFASYLIRFRPKSGINPQYIAYFLKSPDYWTQISEKQAGIAVPNVNARKLAQIKLPLPLPDAQDRIVAELETQLTRLDASVTALKRVQGNLKRYRASVLKAACEGRLDPTEAELAYREGRAYETGTEFLVRVLTNNAVKSRRRDNAEVPDRSSLPPLPQGWTWATLPQLGELNREKSKHRPRDDERLYGGPYPFIQTGDIRKSAGTVRDHSQTYSEFGLAQSRLWPAGTLCITIAANIAETGVLTFPACFPDSVVGFIHEGARETTRWVDLFLRTAKEKLERFAPATAQKNINLDVLRKVAVPLPPLAEQLRIVAEVERRLSVIEEIETIAEANLRRSRRLRDGLLKQAFAGGKGAPTPR